MNSNYHVDMKYSIPKPKSDIKPHSKVKDFVVMTAATAVMACGIYFFKFANNFAFGGITGLAVLVAKTGVISSGDFNFVCNIVLLVLGFLVLGKGFGAKTFYCSMLLSFLLSILERVYPMDGPLTNQPVLELMFAIAVPAFGSAILFNMGASSGGTDIVAMILKKYTGYDIGRVLMLSDVAIAVAGVQQPGADLQFHHPGSSQRSNGLHGAGSFLRQKEIYCVDGVKPAPGSTSQKLYQRDGTGSLYPDL